MAYKQGANVSDINKIKSLHGEGRSADEISKALEIDISIVKKFIPSLGTGASVTKKTKDGK